jgi:DNA (cytosine-5)-methyltransferase 1
MRFRTVATPLRGRRRHLERKRSGDSADAPRQPRSAGAQALVNGFWADAEWVYCRDNKYRPVEPGTFPLVNGATNRVGRLRGYGNAIVAPVAQAFIEAYLNATS